MKKYYFLLSFVFYFGIGTGLAQYTDLVNFTGNSGAYPGESPEGSLTLSGGVFYGMTKDGGANGNGVIFSYNPTTNVYDTLVNFTGSNGANPGVVPYGSLTLSGGVFYGMTAGGGANGEGVIFSYNPTTNVYTDLINFTGTGGAAPGKNPYGSLTLSGGVLYGMTNAGGTNGDGVIFSYNPTTDVYDTLVNFTGNTGANQGENPYGSLTPSGGVFYGMTDFGGADGNGVIFSYNPTTNVYTDLVNFTGHSGAYPGYSPYGSLTLSGGVLYGMTAGGGANGVGDIFSYNPTTNVYTDLVNFTGTGGAAPGKLPDGSLTLSGGVFYGMTTAGGTNGDGVIFSYNPTTNVYTDLVNFTGTSGAAPGIQPNFGSLTPSGGVFYGMTEDGGANGVGVIFSYTPCTFNVFLATLTFPDCGAGQGTASVAVGGGTAPYTYTWSPNVSSAASATNLTPGSYTITVQDQNSCSGTVQVTMP